MCNKKEFCSKNSTETYVTEKNNITLDRREQEYSDTDYIQLAQGSSQLWAFVSRVTKLLFPYEEGVS